MWRALPTLALALIGCGNGADPGGAEAAALPTAAAETPSAIDPEPADAQRLAEQVVNEAWNRDKTTRLVMHISTLVERRSGIEATSDRLAARATSLADRLDRLQAEVTAQEVVIRLAAAVLFDFDADAIRGDAEPILAEVVAVLAAYPERPVRIEGHTDAIAAESYNLALSQRRAESVRAWLIEHGVAGDRLKTLGVGESRPLADNATVAGRQQNRRVEIVVERNR